MKMFHTKFYQDRIINEDFEEKKLGGEPQKTLIFQKIEIIFENHRFRELFDNIRTWV